MIQILLVALWLLPLSLSLEIVTSVHPTSIPQDLPAFGISIFIDGTGFSSTTTYSCNWVANPYTWTTDAQFISSTSLICPAPVQDGYGLNSATSGTLTLQKSTTVISTTVIQYQVVSACLSDALPWCGAHGDPHLKPFCNADPIGHPQGYPVQLNAQLNLVTSKDGRFKVYGRTIPTTGNSQVSNLNSISIIGPGTGGYISPNITFDSSTIPVTTVVTVGGVVINPSQLPYAINNEIMIGLDASNWYYAEFPNNETVVWNGKDTTYIYVPRDKYSQNVYGLCGEIDALYQYCKGSDGEQHAIDVGKDAETSQSLNACGDSWVVPYSSNLPNPQPVPAPNIVIPVPIPSPDIQPTPYPDTVPNSQPEPAPSPDSVIPEPSPNGVIPVPSPNGVIPGPAPLPDAYVVPDNFVSRVIKTICTDMFNVLEDVCPAEYQQNLPIYESSCVYDGAALLSYRFDQLKIDGSIIDDPGSFFTNAEQLAETVFDDSTYYFMVSSVRAGIHDCFFQAQNISIVEPVFNVNVFRQSLPGCTSFCKYPGSTCSSNGDCQLSLTLAQLITLTGSASTICMNVLFLIICLLTLSIWN
jgi:hypothetical protein